MKNKNNNRIKINENNKEEEKSNEILIFIKEYEGKKLYSGIELIKIFKNPLKYQRKDLKFNDLFDRLINELKI